MSFDLRQIIAFDFAKELCAQLGHDFDEARLKRVARHADSLILAGSTAPPAFAESIELELLGLIDDSGMVLSVTPAPPDAPPKLERHDI